MRILYDHQVTSLQDAGGISLYFYQLIRHLIQNREVDTRLLLGLNSSVIPFPSLTGTNCHITSSKTRLKAGFVRYATNDLIVNGLASVSGQFDIYHPTLYRCLPLVRSKAIVVTHYDCIMELFPDIVEGSAWRRKVKKRQFAQADAVISISENSRKDLLKFYDIPHDRIHVIYLGVTQLPSGLHPLRDHDKRPYILYVGTRKLCKNFDGFIKACAASGLPKEFRVICAGGGNFSREEALLIEREGLDSKITLLPRVSSEQLGSLYREAHAFVYPSLYEGFGLPPIEAMGCGTVPVVSNTSSMPEVCGDAAIYFDPYSVESMVDSLQKACYDETSRKEIREKGKDVGAKYTWEECARKTLQVYREVLTAR